MAGGLLAWPLAGTLGAALAGPAIGVAAALLRQVRPLAGPDRLSPLRAALSGLLAASVSQLCARLLVANWSDNAYLAISLYGWALQLPAALFLLAAIAPWAGLARWSARGAVVLVWLLGALAVLPLPFSLYALASVLANGSAGDWWRQPVAGGHLLMGLLALALMGFTVCRWPRELTHSPGPPG